MTAIPSRRSPAVLAAAFRMHTQTSFSTGSGPAGSAAYRQEIAFAQCMRSHGLANVPDPPPGASISVPLPQDGLDACKQLVPGGKDTTNIQITL